MDYEYLNAIRIESGLTNKAIAQAKNLSESTVSRFFHGEIKDPSGPLIAAICDAIGASLDRAFGLVRSIDATMTHPTPDLKAVATSVLESLPPLVDERQVADQVAGAIDSKEIARAVIDAMPIKDCASCKSAAVYESVIAFHRKLLAILGSTLGLMTLFLMILLIIHK